MIYCDICGHHFPDDALDATVIGGMMANSCPACGSEDSLIVVCDECGAYIHEQGIGHLCRACAVGFLSYKAGMDFLRGSGYLADFVFAELYGIPAPITNDPAEKGRLEKLAITLYQRQVIDDVLTGGHECRDKLIAYILDDDPGFADSFAEWLKEQEVTK